MKGLGTPGLAQGKAKEKSYLFFFNTLPVTVYY